MSGVIAAVAVGTAISIGFQIDARNKTKQANRKAARIDAIQRQRERTRALAENRVNQAALSAQATNAGIQGSSGVQGSIGSFQSTAAANFNFAQSIEGLSAQQQRLLSSAGKSQMYAGFGETISSLGLMYGNFKAGQTPKPTAGEGG